MSHFSSIKTEYKDTQCLIAALEEQFGKGHVEFNEEGAALIGYHQDDRSLLPKSDPNYAPKCQIVVRRKHVGSASNDVGYRRNEDGTYTAFISEYDSTGNFNQTKQKAVKQNYTANVTKKTLTRQGYQVQLKKQTNGTLKITATKFSK